MARSPIPQMIEDFHQMSPEEQRCFLDLVDPQPEPEPAKKPQKKSSKKPAGKGGGGKSARGESLKGQLDKQLSGRRQEQEPLCIGRAHSGGCGAPEDSVIHHDATYLSHHEFVAPPATHAATGSTGD